MLFTDYQKNYAKLLKRTLSARKSLAIGLAFLLFAGASWLTLHRDALSGQSRTPVETATQAVATAAEFPPAALTGAPDETTQRHINEVYSQLPMSFEANEGQLDSRVKFRARGSGYQLFLTPTEAVLTLRKANGGRRKENSDAYSTNPQSAVRNPQSAVVRMKLIDANPAPQVSGQDELSTKTNYFIGDDPQKWRTGVASYAQVRYGEVYPGVDMIYYGRQRQLEYDFVVAPGAEVSAINLGFAGVQRMRLDAGGNLVLRTAGGEVRQQRPVVYQEVDGERKEIAGRYVLKGEREVGFAVGEYDASRELVIDPVLLYSTYLGGNGNDVGEGIAVGTAGHVYVTGYTDSSDFPKLNQYQGDQPYPDVFVTKLDTTAAGTASLLYSTYLGGNGADYGYDIAVDAAGHAYVTGQTCSSNFPKLNEYQGYRGAGANCGDAFVTKLDTTAAGAASILYSTPLGGNGIDDGYGIAVDNAGHAYVMGDTTSGDFPKLNEYQGYQYPYQAPGDVFVTKLDTTAAGTASLLYSTYLGGSSWDYAYGGIAVDNAGHAYVTGNTYSSNFPTLHEYQGDQPGTIADAFVTKLDTTAAGAASLLYSTYLGGSGYDYGEGIAVNTAGHVYVTGYTNSSDFPKQHEYQGYQGGGNDAFVTKLDTMASGTASLLYSTYLGGRSDDRGSSIAVDTVGHAYVAGSTSSSDFPKLNEYQGYQSHSDVFVTKLDMTAAGTSSLLYSTYLGGNVRDYGYDIAVDTAGHAYVVGQTDSTNYPKLNEYQGDQYFYDVFVTKLSSDGTTPGAGLQYYPLATPVRLLDTRPGQSACDNPAAPLGADATRTQAARTPCSTIPANARVIVGNATVVNNTAGAGFITLYPSGVARPTASNLNYVAGQVVPNAFTVGLGTDGAFQIYSSSSTNFIVDVTGYYAPPGAGGLYYHPLPTPVRLLDTRGGQSACDTPGVPLGAGGVRTQVAHITCNGMTIPTEAQVIVGNATVVNNTAGATGGFITLYPSSAALPNVSNLNYVAGQVVPNAFTVALGGDGGFNIYATSSTHFIVDVTGYYSTQATDVNGTGMLYNPLSSPVRLLDTRSGQAACDAPGVPLSASAVKTQAARNVCGIPAPAQVIVGNATVVNNTSEATAGFITLYPSGVALPTVSNLNYVAGQIVPNAFTLGLGADGAFNIYATSSTHFIVDVTGYFAP